MKYTYRMFEDNAGGLHLAILNEDGECVYYLSDFDRDLVLDTLSALKDGGDPIADSWDGGEEDPAARLREIVDLVDAGNGGAEEHDA